MTKKHLSLAELERLTKKGTSEESCLIIDELKYRIKQKTHANDALISWAIDTASEYNPKNFKEALRLCIKLIKIKRAHQYTEGMSLTLY